MGRIENRRPYDSRFQSTSLQRVRRWPAFAAAHVTVVIACHVPDPAHTSGSSPRWPDTRMQKGGAGATGAGFSARFSGHGGGGGGARLSSSAESVPGGSDESEVSMTLSRGSPGLPSTSGGVAARRPGSHPPPGRGPQPPPPESSASSYDGGSTQDAGALARAHATIDELRAALDASNQAAAAAAAELMQTKAQLGTAWRRLVAADSSVGTTRGFWTREAFLGQARHRRGAPAAAAAAHPRARARRSSTSTSPRSSSCSSRRRGRGAWST